MTIETQRFLAEDLFKIDHIQSLPGMPVWANLRFRKKKFNRSNFSGPGIYAILFNKQLIYIGKFLGKKTDPRGGDIRDARWDKHLGSMTLRSRNISFSKKSLDRVLQSNAPHLVGDLRQSNQQALLRDRGCLSTFNRFAFGSHHWDQFQNLDESHLKLFQFLYVRVSTFTSDTTETRKLVSDAEDQLVKLFNPYCNAVVDFPEDPSKHEMHTTEEVHQTISDVLSRFTADSAPAMTTNKAVHDSRLQTPMKGSVDEDDEEKTSSSLFYERMETAPEGASHLVRGICEEFSHANETEVHFKKRKPPDLRVRDLRLGASGKKSRLGQNIFTLEWHPTKNEFMCRALLSPAQCRAYGISNATRPAVQTEPLNSEFRFPADGGLDMLIKVIYSSIDIRSC